MEWINKLNIIHLEKNIIYTAPLDEKSLDGWWGDEAQGVEPYSKCPFSNHQSQQRIQILGYLISEDAVIRDKIFNTQNNEFFN